MDHTEPIVAVGLLTARDLQRLGQDFERAYPITNDGRFDDLLQKLDRIETRDPNITGH